MFCRSVELGTKNSFTHYLYMPFANNDGNCHSKIDSDLLRGFSEEKLERAGADFMLHCFRRQMKGVYSRSSTWNLPSPLPDLEDTERKFAMEVEKFAIAMMLVDVGSLLTSNASDIAPATAAGLPKIRLPAGVWNGKARMMLVDVGSLLTSNASDIAPATAAGLPKIRLPAGVWNGKARRLLATLRVKLGLFLVHIGLEDQLDKEGNLESKIIGALGSCSVALPGGTTGTHKGFDIWFKTKVNELVLLDVTGATNAGTCKAKAEQIAQNAAAVMNEAQMQNATVLVESVICVLLAPNCDSAIEEPPSAQVVQGDAARDLLGGLQQLLPWLGYVDLACLPEKCPATRSGPAALPEWGKPDVSLVISRAKRLHINERENRRLAPPDALLVEDEARGAVPTNAPQRLRLIGAGGKVQKGTFLTVEALEGDVVRLESGQSFAGPELLKHTRLCSAITCASVQD
eukprot:s8121_g1.t2